jgi:hypothetical protein
VVVEFDNPPAETAEMKVLFKGRRILVSDGSFRDSFAEADVHVCRVVVSTMFLPLVMKLPARAAQLSAYGKSDASKCGVIRAPSWYL